MKKEIETLFKEMEGCFDIYETPAGHQSRFLDKLNQHENKKKSNRIWLRPLAIAASIALIITLGVFANSSNTPEGELASVSPEMEKTQTFFVATLNKEMETLKGYESETTKEIIADVELQLSTLEKEYNKLKIDLVESGNDKRVIYAMISNFQQRINLLEQVIIKIEEVKSLKANQNETFI